MTTDIHGAAVGSDPGSDPCGPGAEISTSPTASDPSRLLSMPRHVLYAYVNGSDLDNVADALRSRACRVCWSRRWLRARHGGVNQRTERRSSHPVSCPIWLQASACKLPEPGAGPPGNSATLRRLPSATATLHAQSGRDFNPGRPVFNRTGGLRDGQRLRRNQAAAK